MSANTSIFFCFVLGLMAITCQISYAAQGTEPDDKNGSIFINDLRNGLQVINDTFISIIDEVKLLESFVFGQYDAVGKTYTRILAQLPEYEYYLDHTYCLSADAEHELLKVFIESIAEGNTCVDSHVHLGFLKKSDFKNITAIVEDKIKELTYVDEKCLTFHNSNVTLECLAGLVIELEPVSVGLHLNVEYAIYDYEHHELPHNGLAAACVNSTSYTSHSNKTPYEQFKNKSKFILRNCQPDIPK